MSSSVRRGALAPLALAALVLAGCQDDDPARQAVRQCAPDNGGLTLPEGFCAIVAHEGVGPARHLAVAPNGDVFVAIRDRQARDGQPATIGGIAALRDTDGDGTLDMETRFGPGGGNDVLLTDSALYFATDDAVIRFFREQGALTPIGRTDTIVGGLPAGTSHAAKSIALGPDRTLYVNIGAPSNACQEEARTAGSPGLDPCPQLETRGGIWRFDGLRRRQTQADGMRHATGLRNVVALAWHPEWNALYGVQHGRDQLHDLFPDLYTVEENAELPAEEFVRILGGQDFGWPYCYYDHLQGQKVLAPEYGGDGTEVGRCAEAEAPLLGFPGHWAPNDLEFYTGTSFPERYRNGAFIAFHGSWNRAPEPQEGYKVVFVPMNGGIPAGEWEVFADGFREPEGSDRGWSARPVGLAQGPDGALWITDSLQGRIWRIVWRGD